MRNLSGRQRLAVEFRVSRSSAESIDFARSRCALTTGSVFAAKVLRLASMALSASSGFTLTSLGALPVTLNLLRTIHMHRCNGADVVRNWEGIPRGILQFSG